MFYANADTDWVVRPDSMGAETHDMLHSIDSPNSCAYTSGCNPGPKLKLGDRGEAQIVQNGKRRSRSLWVLLLGREAYSRAR